jgi:hypothetical protein
MFSATPCPALLFVPYPFFGQRASLTPKFPVVSVARVESKKEKFRCSLFCL